MRSVNNNFNLIERINIKMLDKCTMRTEVLYNDEKTHRYSLKKSWDSSKPSASIIMISLSDRANEICLDMTTIYTVNNCYHQGFGSVEILNLYSKINAEPFENDLENNERIIDSCKKTDKIIFACGKAQTKKDILFRIMEVLKLLEPYEDKSIKYQMKVERMVIIRWELLSD